MRRGLMAMLPYMLCGLGIMCWTGAFAAEPAGQGAAVGEKKRELRELQRQLRRSKQQLQQHGGQEQSILEHLDAISRRQADIAQEAHATAQALRATQERAAALEADRDRLSEQLEQQRQRLQQRVRQLYKLGQLPYVKLLLAAKDVAEFSRKVQYINHLAAHDQQRLEAYRQRQEQLAEAQSELAAAMRQTQAEQAAWRDKRKALAHERAQQAALLDRVRAEKALTKKAVDEVAKAAKAMTRLIARLQDQAKQPQTRQRAVKGKLFWPVEGAVLSSYGRERHPTFDVVTFQKGMYIGAPFGHDVRAAADGKVVYADWFKGLGRLLLVDHGDHVMTLYGHTSAIVVRQGDRVHAQQVVAKVGDSSAFGEPALYFAVRYQTAPQDPLQWLRQRHVRLTERPLGGAGDKQ